MNLRKVVKEGLSQQGSGDKNQLLMTLAIIGVSHGFKLHVTSDLSVDPQVKTLEQSRKYQKAASEAAGRPIEAMSHPSGELLEKSNDELWEKLQECCDDENIRGAGNWLAAIWPIVIALFDRIFGGEDEPSEPIEPPEEQEEEGQEDEQSPEQPSQQQRELSQRRYKTE